MTYDLLDSTTLASSASSVTFSSISQDYRDLILVVEGNGTNSVDFNFRLNSDTGSNYAYVRMRGNGSTAASSSNSSSTFIGAIVTGADATNRGMAVFQVLDYSATDKHKTALLRVDNAGLNTAAAAGRWASTSAVTSITAITFTNQFASGMSLYLYGIAA